MHWLLVLFHCSNLRHQLSLVWLDIIELRSGWSIILISRLRCWCSLISYRDDGGKDNIIKFGVKCLIVWPCQSHSTLYAYEPEQFSPCRVLFSSCKFVSDDSFRVFGPGFVYMIGMHSIDLDGKLKILLNRLCLWLSLT